MVETTKKYMCNCGKLIIIKAKLDKKNDIIIITTE